MTSHRKREQEQPSLRDTSMWECVATAVGTREELTGENEERARGRGNYAIIINNHNNDTRGGDVKINMQTSHSITMPAIMFD
jgi:hypothetical protein